MQMPGRSFSSESYRYGFNGIENDNEIKGDGNSLDFGARIYDSRLGRWLSVDPDYMKYPGWSGYNAFNNSPLIIVDPTGNGGEAVIEDGKMVIYMDFYIYGDSKRLTPELAIERAEALQSALNKHPSQAVAVDGNTYDVTFKINGYVVTESDAIEMAKQNTGDNFDPRMNFVRVDDRTNQSTNSSQKSLTVKDGKVSASIRTSATGPDNSINISSDRLMTNSWIHEVAAHFLWSRGTKPKPGSHITKWSDNPSSGKIPSIRTTILTDNVPESLLNPTTGKLDIEKREILPEDKQNIIIKLIYTSQGNKYWVGGATNTIFGRQGNQTTFDNNGKKIEN
jgi:RHS repeat-associated protein